MPCSHEMISVKSLRDARCDRCGEKVAMESLDRGDAKRPFYWPKATPENRTSAHPANDSAFHERSPGEWVMRRTA